MRMQIGKYLLMGICCIMLIACTQIELCYQYVHPHIYNLAVNYHWESDQTPPQRMYIIANRVVNICRYLFDYELATNTFYKAIYYPGGEQQTEYYDYSYIVTPIEPSDNIADLDSLSTVTPFTELDTVRHENHDDFAIRAGQYEFFTFNSNDSLTLENLHEFYSDRSASLSILRLSHKSFPQPVLHGKVVNNWVDMNQGYDYCVNTGPIYKASSPGVIEDEGKTTIDFYPESMSQHLEFQFTLRCDSGVVVDRVVAELSGVVSSMQLSTGYVSMDATQSKRILFEATPNAKTGLITCTGSVDVLGLINSYTKDLRSGPGILYIGVSVHANNRTTGQEIRKTCYAQMNMFQLINENPLLENTEDKRHYILATHQASFQIQQELSITYQELMGEYESQGRVDQWIKQPSSKGLDIEI